MLVLLLYSLRVLQTHGTPLHSRRHLAIRPPASADAHQVVKMRGLWQLTEPQARSILGIG